MKTVPDTLFCLSSSTPLTRGDFLFGVLAPATTGRNSQTANQKLSLCFIAKTPNKLDHLCQKIMSEVLCSFAQGHIRIQGDVHPILSPQSVKRYVQIQSNCDENVKVQRV